MAASVGAQELTDFDRHANPYAGKEQLRLAGLRPQTEYRQPAQPTALEAHSRQGKKCVRYFHWNFSVSEART